MKLKLKTKLNQFRDYADDDEYKGANWVDS